MHGVPTNLDLSFLHGAEVEQVCLGLYQVQIHFHPVGSISDEGDWALIGSDGIQVDRNDPARQNKSSQLSRFLGCRVVGTDIASPEWFALRFDDGLVLRVFDSSSQYESFSIQPGNIFV
jgi:hypothetical protein